MDRRAFIRGAGTTLLLPWLPSALPARAATSGPARRLVYWFLPNGLIPEETSPSTEGADYDLPPVLAELAPVKHRVSVMSGLVNVGTQDGVYSTHEECMASLLSDEKVDYPLGRGIEAGSTVDQYAAKVAGQATPFSSLVLGTNELDIGNGAFSSVYYRTLSWGGPGKPISPITNPRVLFERMFAGTDATATAKEIALRRELRKSVLDAVGERTARLQSRLDAADRAKLDQFATGVRELELRIDQLAERVCPQPDAPAPNIGFPDAVDAMHDLLVLAIQCDQTRFATFALGPTVSTRSYPFLGVASDHHSLSHGWVYSVEDRADILRIQGWAIGRWGDLAAKLAAISDGEGDLLSNTMLLLVTEFGDSNAHVATPLPMLVAGGEAGGAVQGRHRVYQDRPHVDLLATTLEFAGVDSTGFGRHQTGPIDLSTV